MKQVRLCQKLHKLIFISSAVNDGSWSPKIDVWHDDAMVAAEPMISNSLKRERERERFVCHSELQIFFKKCYFWIGDCASEGHHHLKIPTVNHFDFSIYACDISNDVFLNQWQSIVISSHFIFLHMTSVCHGERRLRLEERKFIRDDNPRHSSWLLLAYLAQRAE